MAIRFNTVPTLLAISCYAPHSARVILEKDAAYTSLRQLLDNTPDKWMVVIGGISMHS